MTGQESVRYLASAANPHLKELARLKERRGRRKAGLYLVEGLREAQRALDGGVIATELLLAPDIVSAPSETLAGLLEAARVAGAEEVHLSPAAFAQLSLRDKPDGVVLVARSRQLSPASAGLHADSLVLVVDGLEKPGNLGALMRTADAVGVDALLLCGSGSEAGGTDLENPNVIRASMGSVFAMTTATGSRAEVAAALAGAGLRLVAATPHASGSMWDADLTGGVALLLGTEGAGLPQWWLGRADLHVRIPMRATAADSLNVSVAGAVLLYEALRQRSAGPQ
ncbi:MAG: RNA methyltransferase [Trueperaceae bacterium]